ncbi:hypothetical protein MCAP1_002117 [Malassezia caprae]|uniref:Bin3-type SAM domain-containing protein n=1 Tax=Malassezia caprae TaxID=1381934 RepID=A0AAF0EC11_9BASI|nr:hypothetical protein MCAP1_002117 [Malassezia caprae]
MPDVPVHGNFRRYYGMRSARAAARACGSDVCVPRDGIDERVRCLLDWLAQHGTGVRIERVLDIGCNAAKPLLELCQLLPNAPTYVLGVDIDVELVAQARAALRQAWCERQPRAQETTVAAMQYFPACFSGLLDPLPLAPPGTDTLPARVQFVQGDWPRMDADPVGFDLILCLAVSKWIHLNQGDDGLFLCLSQMASQLRPGGLVAMEIQPWQSYEQARSLSKELRASHAQLRIQPDDIEWVLDTRTMYTGPLSVDVTRHYADEIWDADQKRVVAAIGDAIIAPLTPDELAEMLGQLPSDMSEAQRARLREYAHMKFTDVPNAVHLVAMHVVETVSFKLRFLMGVLLKTLSTRAGCLALTGRVGPLWDLDTASITLALNRWRDAPIELLRLGQFGLSGLIRIVFYRHMEQANEALGYPTGPSNDWQNPPKAEPQTAKPHYDFTFLNDQLPREPSDTPVEFEADVVIVGSGCGGAVVAAYLAERGLRVIVVDKGLYVRPDEMPMTQDFAMEQMFERLGFVPTANLSLAVLAGSGWGGGSTINWSATLEPRHYVRHTWAKQYGVPYFSSSLFAQDLRACAQRMGTTDKVQHNKANSLLLLGGQRSGQPVATVPQNNGHMLHYCGQCHFGCPSGHKQSTIMTWLADAAQHNAQFLVHCDIDRVLVERGRATGVVGNVRGQRVIIKGTKAVTVSAGSINTPAILLRTPELKVNRQIGEHLHLHPVAFVHGFYEQPIDPWEGPILSTVSNAAELVDPSGWGAKIEIMVSAPSLFCALLPFDNALQHKKMASRYRYGFTIIVIVRDRDGGRVKLDKYGRALMEYTLSKFDEKSMLAGVLRATEIHASAGASMITTSQFNAPWYEAPLAGPSEHPVVPETWMAGSHTFETVPPQRSLTEPRFVAFQRQIEKIGFQTLRAAIGSAHQMSSCRMGANPSTSACDTLGRVRGVKGLWVADGSSLPESSGVNPMLTILGTARGIARNMARELGVAMPSDLGTTPVAHL